MTEQTTEPLPPFSGDDTACPKCGHKGATTRYRAARGRLLWNTWNDDIVMRGPLPERLQRECDRCQYCWDEALQPPAHDAGPSVAECAASDRLWPLQKAGE